MSRVERAASRSGAGQFETRNSRRASSARALLLRVHAREPVEHGDRERVIPEIHREVADPFGHRHPFLGSSPRPSRYRRKALSGSPAASSIFPPGRGGRTTPARGRSRARSDRGPAPISSPRMRPAPRRRPSRARKSGAPPRAKSGPAGTEPCGAPGGRAGILRPASRRGRPPRRTRRAAGRSFAGGERIVARLAAPSKSPPPARPPRSIRYLRRPDGHRAAPRRIRERRGSVPPRTSSAQPRSTASGRVRTALRGGREETGRAARPSRSVSRSRGPGGPRRGEGRAR